MNNNELDAHLEANVALWEGLKDAGIVEGSPLTAEVVFYAPGPNSRDALVGLLTAENVAHQVAEERVGLLRRKKVWLIEGSVDVPSASLEAFNAMSTSMQAFADQAGASYDGWGVMIGPPGE